MSDPFPNLAAHMSYEHHFHVELVESLEPLELLELHENEHDSGFPAHVHDWEPA